MSALKRIVFFWVGEDVGLPSLLVASIRRHLPGTLEVVQLSNPQTPKVHGITRHVALELSQSLMVARLEAYSSLAIAEPTLYLDSDMLVVRPFDLPALAPNEIGVTPRKERDDGLLQESGQQRLFPEFEGRTLREVMPYIYSFVYTRSEIVFARQLELLRTMSAPLQAWFGDQVTLKDVLERPPFVAREFNADIYNRTVKTMAEYHAACTAADAPCILHFKGMQAKQVMTEVSARPEHAQKKRRRWWKWRA
jgi:hypothetical protein